MSLGSRRISDIIEEEIEEDIEFVAAMVGITPEDLLRNAIQQHLDHRAGLTEFPQQVAQQVTTTKEVGDRLARRHAKVMRQRAPEPETPSPAKVQ